MNGKSDRPISFSVSFCICGRSFKLISFTFVCKRETLGAVHSTQLWVLVKYHLFLIIMGVLYLNKTNNFILIKRLFQQFQNFTFENISLCLGKHFDDWQLHLLIQVGIKIIYNAIYMSWESRIYSKSRMSKILTFCTCKLWADIVCAWNIESP